MDIIQELYYDYNYNLFLIKLHLHSIQNSSDRNHVAKWVKKLNASNRTVDEMRLRNDFMHYLALCVYSKSFDPPFDASPPCEELMEITNLLPGGGQPADDNNKDPWDEEESPFDEKPMLYSNSPDGGAFLAAQPIPRYGTFCYLAVISRSDNKTD